MNEIEQLEKLAKLKESGILTEEEFSKKKHEILNQEPAKAVSNKDTITKEESLVWNDAPSQLTNLPMFIILGLLSIFIFIIPFTALAALWSYLVTKNQKYELTTQRLKTYEGVLSKKMDELELYRVTDTRFDQSFFLRIFGLGDIVLITTDKTSPTIKIKAVKNPRELREQIRELVDARRDIKRVREVEFN
jgi:uncharacterized membrane protein YdbT with pleckstrin-like domain